MKLIKDPGKLEYMRFMYFENCRERLLFQDKPYRSLYSYYKANYAFLNDLWKQGQPGAFSAKLSPNK